MFKMLEDQEVDASVSVRRWIDDFSRTGAWGEGVGVVIWQ